MPASRVLETFFLGVRFGSLQAEAGSGWLSVCLQSLAWAGDNVVLQETVQMSAVLRPSRIAWDHFHGGQWFLVRRGCDPQGPIRCPSRVSTANNLHLLKCCLGMLETRHSCSLTYVLGMCPAGQCSGSLRAPAEPTGPEGIIEQIRCFYIHCVLFSLVPRAYSLFGLLSQVLCPSADS